MRVRGFPVTAIAVLAATVASCSQGRISFGQGEVPPVKAIEIPAGPFLYGTTEGQFQLFLDGLRVNYPGMQQQIRSTFVIPPQTIELEAFYMDEFEVSNAEFEAFLSSTDYTPSNPSNFLKGWADGRLQQWARDFPVVWVSGLDAVAYCQWKGGRLPTEREWEKAARGAEGYLFPWGNETLTARVSNFSSEAVEPIGNRAEDRSPYGIYDLGGNVAELAHVVDPGTRRPFVARGGSFQSGLSAALTFQRRVQFAPSLRAENAGFRCAYDELPTDSDN